MRTKKLKNIEGRWSRVTHEIATYKYILNDTEVANIFPKELRDGKMAWAYFIKRIGKATEINSSNYTTAPVKLEAHYTKKRDAKKAVESVIERIACQ